MPPTNQSYAEQHENIYRCHALNQLLFQRSFHRSQIAVAPPLTNSGRPTAHTFGFSLILQVATQRLHRHFKLGKCGSYTAMFAHEATTAMI